MIEMEGKQYQPQETYEERNMEPGRKTVDDLVRDIRQRIQEYYWQENIVSRLSAMRAIEHLAHVAVLELEDQYII